MTCTTVSSYSGAKNDELERFVNRISKNLAFQVFSTGVVQSIRVTRAKIDNIRMRRTQIECVLAMINGIGPCVDVVNRDFLSEFAYVLNGDRLLG